MIKQIKRVTAITLVGLVGLSSVAPSIYANYRVAEASISAVIPSDVVENKSVIEKQNQIEEISKEKQENKVAETTPIPAATPKPKIYKKGWTTTEVEVKKKPKTKSATVTTLKFNKRIKYSKYNKKWIEYKYKGKICYIAKKYIAKTKCKYKEYTLPKGNGFKSFMGYKAITSRSSKQYILQSNYAYTGKYGIRQVNGRYCVALGSYFKVKIGQYFDLVLKNGTVIKCIAGDAKADKDTDSQHIFTGNGCCSEFIVDMSALISSVKRSGNVSSANKKWIGSVKSVRIYKKNVFK